MDYALGLSQPSNTAGARCLLSGAGPNLDDQERSWSFENVKFHMIDKIARASGLKLFSLKDLYVAFAKQY